MSYKCVKSMKSEIYVPNTPSAVWTPVEKEVAQMKIALVSGAGVHMKQDECFKLAGDTSYRTIPGTANGTDLTVTHGGYDNGDVKKDINSMFPIDRIKELVTEGFIDSFATTHYSFMGGGGNQKIYTELTGPQIARLLKKDNVDAVVLTAG